MKVNYFFVCDKAELDTDTGKLSAQGIFDGVGAENFPAIHPSFSIVVSIDIDTDEAKNSLEERTQITFGEKIIVETDIVKTKIGVLRHNFLHRLDNVYFEGPGKYDLKLFLDGKKVGESYFDVAKV